VTGISRLGLGVTFRFDIEHATVVDAGRSSCRWW
jgi:hypothetical protein